MAKVIKLKSDGKDFGYVVADGEVLYGGGSRSNAVEFDLIRYRNNSDIHYLKVAGTREFFVNVKLSNSILRVEKAECVNKSNICAWQLVDSKLKMILPKNPSEHCLSRCASDDKNVVLYGHSQGSYCEVIMEDA